MTPPCGGRSMGTASTKCTSPSRAFSRTRSSSFWPPTVWLATMRIFFKRCSLLLGGRGHGSRRRRRHLARLLEDAVDGARHPVLVRPANDGGAGVEVEDGRRRQALPLERQGAPGVGLGARAAAPAR